MWLIQSCLLGIVNYYKGTLSRNNNERISFNDVHVLAYIGGRASQKIIKNVVVDASLLTGKLVLQNKCFLRQVNAEFSLENKIC
jgi:hypothetical protein